MSRKSFYSLEYMIEINEKRIEGCIAAYHYIIGRFTDILMVYTGIAIFLIPICQEVFKGEISHWLFIFSFLSFSVLFLSSVYYSVRFIIPVNMAFLDSPRRYYNTMRLAYETTLIGSEMNVEEVDRLTQASYLNELEEALDVNELNFLRKSSFFFRSLVLGLSSAIPFIVCLGFHILKQKIKFKEFKLLIQEKIVIKFKNKNGYV